MNQYIGIAGITSADESRAIATMLTDLDPTGARLGDRKVMIGVLASAKSLAGIRNSQWKRYPAPADIAKCFVEDNRFINAVHIAPGDDASAADVLCDGIRTAGRMCECVQVNAVWPKLSMLLAARGLGDEIIGRPYSVVLQIGPEAITNMRRPLHEFTVDYYLHGGLPFDAILYDVSAGKGVGLDVHSIVATAHTLRDTLKGTGVSVGIAGGLDAEAVAHLVIAALMDKGVSVDAEGRLRDGSPDGGNLDLAKVRAYLDAALGQ